jgi:hypothetical protein
VHAIAAQVRTLLRADAKPFVSSRLRQLFSTPPQRYFSPFSEVRGGWARPLATSLSDTPSCAACLQPLPAAIAPPPPRARPSGCLPSLVTATHCCLQIAPNKKAKNLSIQTLYGTSLVQVLFSKVYGEGIGTQGVAPDHVRASLNWDRRKFGG